MKKLILFIFTNYFLFVMPSAYGAPVPDELLNLPISLITKQTTSLAEYKDKRPVYLKFWATWCQPCMKEMPHFQHVHSQYGEAIEVIGVNLGVNDDLEAVQQVITKFGLTMPLAMDKSGDLAQAFKMIGTPYHLLFDQNMNLVHRGHKASESLNNKLDLLAQSETVDSLDKRVLAETEMDINIDLDDGKLHALFFTATWCDWYLKDTRPQVSQSCIKAQNAINAFANEYTEIVWQGVVSRLWTGEKDLAEYQKKYLISHQLVIDKSNRLFHQYLIKQLPTLVLVKDGKVSARVTDFSDLNKIKAHLNTQ